MTLSEPGVRKETSKETEVNEGTTESCSSSFKKKFCLEVNFVFMSDKNQKILALTRVLWLF